MPDRRADAVRCALSWVKRVFDQHTVPFQIVGGAAAFAHGGRRPIVDLDLYAPITSNSALLDGFGSHLVWGPESYRDDHWDLTFLKIDYAGVRIEIGDTDTSPRYYSATRERWIDQDIDFTDYAALPIFGVVVPVMPLRRLLQYKRDLARDVDLVDVEQLERIGNR